jgi:hypothetical protein
MDNNTNEGAAPDYDKEYDVIYGGRGRTIWTKTNGWKRYRYLIDQNTLEYKELYNNKSKFAFENVVKPILGLGGNFFISGSSKPMTKKAILERVTGAFRDNKKFNKPLTGAMTPILPTLSMNAPTTTMTTNESSQSHSLNISPLCGIKTNDPSLMVNENESIGKLPPSSMMLQPSIHEKNQPPRNMNTFKFKRNRSKSFDGIILQLRDNMNAPSETNEIKRSRSFDDQLLRNMNAPLTSESETNPSRSSSEGSIMTKTISHFLISSPPRTIAEMNTNPLVPDEISVECIDIKEEKKTPMFDEDKETLKEEEGTILPEISTMSAQHQSQSMAYEEV